MPDQDVAVDVHSHCVGGVASITFAGTVMAPRRCLGRFPRPSDRRSRRLTALPGPACSSPYVRGGAFRRPGGAEPDSFLEELLLADAQPLARAAELVQNRLLESGREYPCHRGGPLSYVRL